MTSVVQTRLGSCHGQCPNIARAVSSTNQRSRVLLTSQRHWCLLRVAGKKRAKRRNCGLLRISAISVSERYEEVSAQDPVKPLRHPLAAWSRWWYIGATPAAELPKSQKFTRIMARLWSIMKHSKTSLSFAVTFMVSVW